MQFVAPERYASLKATGKLPSPKGVAFSIIKLLQRDDYRIADLVQLVQSDPAIAGRILYFANAAAFGRSRPIASLQRAIVALGSFRVRDLVIDLSIMHSHKSGQCKSFDYEDFWGHSLATGIACQELALLNPGIGTHACSSLFSPFLSPCSSSFFLRFDPSQPKTNGQAPKFSQHLIYPFTMGLGVIEKEKNFSQPAQHRKCDPEGLKERPVMGAS